LSMR